MQTMAASLIAKAGYERVYVLRENSSCSILRLANFQIVSSSNLKVFILLMQLRIHYSNGRHVYNVADGTTYLQYVHRFFHS